MIRLPAPGAPQPHPRGGDRPSPAFRRSAVQPRSPRDPRVPGGASLRPAEDVGEQHGQVPDLTPHPSPRLAIAAAAALLVTGCAVTPPAGVPSATAPPAGPDASPSVTVSPDPSSTPPPGTSAPSPGTSAPSPGTSSGPAAKAAGKLVFFTENLVSDALNGTCQNRAGRPTLTLDDPRNDFYETVGMTVVLNGARTKVVSVTGAFGEDSEGIVRRLTVGASGEGKGTGATLKVTGTSHRVTGRGQVYENGRATDVIPFTLTTTCSGRW